MSYENITLLQIWFENKISNGKKSSFLQTQRIMALR